MMPDEIEVNNDDDDDASTAIVVDFISDYFWNEFFVLFKSLWVLFSQAYFVSYLGHPKSNVIGK